MKSTLRTQSQLLYRQSYKPYGKTKSGARSKGLVFKPSRAGPIVQFNSLTYES